jgi:histidinol-phosphatase (PHP family)
VLTDYHVHLRPDEPDTAADRFFTRENAARYRAAADERGIVELGVSEHVHRFRAALDVWSHPFWREQAVDDLDEYCDFVREGTDLRLGIEADFVPGREDRMAELLAQRPFDYVVGSVHFLGDVAVDHDGYDIWERSPDPDRVWRRYFETLAAAATSGLFDIVAHPDLVKVWGPIHASTDRGRPLPEGDLRRFYEPAAEAIATAGVAVELSTAGLRKPVGELYPAPAFLDCCVDAGCPIALSSDAHVPADVGFGYDRALAELERVGVGELAVFEQRVRRMEPLG